MNLPLTTSPPPLPASLASDSYPPGFSKTTQELARSLLHPLKPDTDVETTWLNYRDSKVAADDGANIHSVPLISSPVEHFTGLLNWTDNDVQGLYPTPSPTSQTPAIQPLGRAAIVDFYTRVSQQLEQFYSQKLADYWAVATPDGKPGATGIWPSRSSV